MRKTRRTLGRTLWRNSAVFLALACLPARASIFIVAICRDGVVAVADSRFTFSDSDTSRALAYADGLDKIIRFDAALLAETGQGFIADERFDRFVARFSKTAGPLPVELLLPTLLEYGGRRLSAEDMNALAQQHMAVAKFRREHAMICGYDGRLRPCVDRGYVQSSPTDFEKLVDKLPAMTAVETAQAARASMERYIAAKGKTATMGGEFSAALLTADGIRDLWTLRNPIPARTIEELISLVAAHRIPVTLIPPAKQSDLDELLESGPAR
jgi:hypothetical protein